MSSAIDLSKIRPAEIEKDNFFQIFPLSPIKTAKEYEEQKGRLLEIIQFKRDAPQKHYDKMTMKGEYVKHLAMFIKEYEDKKYGIPKRVSGIEALKFLMEQNGLVQIDLKKELGPQSNVSEILRGKRKLTVEQIRALSKRFKLSTDVFMAE